MTQQDKNVYSAEAIASIRPVMPQSVIDARIEAFNRAGAPNPVCEVNSVGCIILGSIAHQKESRYGFFGYREDGAVQSSDNYVICCSVCHTWIHRNMEEAVQLGFLHESWINGFDDSLDIPSISSAIQSIE